MTLTAAPTLAEQLDRPPDAALALRLPGGDVTYGALREWVDATADGLAGGGVGWGSRVLLRVGDDFSRLIGSLAVQRLGAAVVPLNPAVIGAELEYFVAHADAAAAIADEDLADAIAGDPDAGLWINDGGTIALRRPCARRAEPRPPAPEDPASILFTTGSSARARAAVLSHRAHVSMGRDLAGVLGVGAGDSFLALSPLFHVGGWSTAVLPAIAAGAALVFPGPFSASRFWDDVERWRPTHWTTGLAFIEMVAIRGGDPPASVPFRHVLSNLRPNTWRLGRQQLGLPLGTYYGLTENDGRGTIALDVAEYEPGFVGGPYVPWDGVRVTRDGESLPAGEPGSIELHSESAMSGYFRDPEATAETLLPGPWVVTGDRGYLDEHGRLHFQGRFKNIIKRSGENISAEELELFLMEHPDVEDAAALAVPDRVREEEVKVLVVLREGARLTPGELHAHCARSLAAFKVPRYIELVDELPKSVSGKLDTATLRRTKATPEGSWDREA